MFTFQLAPQNKTQSYLWRYGFASRTPSWSEKESEWDSLESEFESDFDSEFESELEPELELLFNQISPEFDELDLDSVFELSDFDSFVIDDSVLSFDI